MIPETLPMIYISNIDDMPHHVRTLAPSHLISVVAPEEQPAPVAEVPAERHLRLAVHDIAEEMAGYIAPGAEHIDELIRFVRDWPAERPLLVHCIAGVSRSTAAALIALVSRSEGSEGEAALRLRARSPHAQPNRRMIALADDLLGCDGRLIASREAMGTGIHGVMRAPLVALPLVP
jgi:predicted protein tyrosine phosphatase